MTKPVKIPLTIVK